MTETKPLISRHLAESGENYWEHLYFTLRMTWALFLTSVTLLIHGLLPFTFTKTASRRVKKASNTFDKRIEQIQGKTSGYVNHADAI